MDGGYNLKAIWDITYLLVNRKMANILHKMILGTYFSFIWSILLVLETDKRFRK